MKRILLQYYFNVKTFRSLKQGYFQGIRDNLEQLSVFYPGWTMRLYFDLDERDPIMDELCLLACSDPKLDLCKVSKLPGNPMTNASEVFPMNWRFFPSVDPQVEVSWSASCHVPRLQPTSSTFYIPWHSTQRPDLLKILDIDYYFLSFKCHTNAFPSFFILHITCAITPKVGSVDEWYEAHQ